MIHSIKRFRNIEIQNVSSFSSIQILTYTRAEERRGADWYKIFLSGNRSVLQISNFECDSLNDYKCIALELAIKHINEIAL